MYLYEKVYAFLQDIQTKFAQISDDDVREVLKNGANKADKIASVKIKEVYKKVGFDV